MSDLADEIDQEVADDGIYRKLLAAERAASQAKAELRGAKKLLVEQEDELTRTHRELGLYDREWKAEPSFLKHKKHNGAKTGTLVSILSDTHYGEVVDPREMSGYNAYNLTIAEQRTRRYFDKLVELPQQYLSGVAYDGIVLALGGDLVSGDIHDELTETNETSTYETISITLPWLIAGIEKLAETYGKVHVVSAPGNHGRRTRKPHAKRFSDDNADTHMARLLAQTVKTSGVTFNIPRSIEARFDVYGTKFRLEHGNAKAFKGGDGIVGSLGPIKRGLARRRGAAQAEGKPFDVLLLGHFHQLVHAPGQGFIANGCLKGPDEYARGSGFSPERAQQSLFLVSPEHGPTSEMPVIVGDRKAEGW